MIVGAVPDKLIGVNIVAGVESEVIGKVTGVLLFSIFILKHGVDASTCCGWLLFIDVEMVGGNCIATELFSINCSGSTLMKSFNEEAGNGSTRFFITEGKGPVCILGVEITDTDVGALAA